MIAKRLADAERRLAILERDDRALPPSHEPDHLWPEIDPDEDLSPGATPDLSRPLHPALAAMSVAELAAAYFSEAQRPLQREIEGDEAGWGNPGT